MFQLNCVDVLHFILREEQWKNLSVYIVAGIFCLSVNASYNFQWERVGNAYERYVCTQRDFVLRQVKKPAPK